MRPCRRWSVCPRRHFWHCWHFGIGAGMQDSSAGALCGLAWFALFTLILYSALPGAGGQTVTCTAVVETDAEASYSDSRLRGTLRLTEINGKPARCGCNARHSPGKARESGLRQSFALEQSSGQPLPPPEPQQQGRLPTGGISRQLPRPCGQQASAAICTFRLRQRWSAVLRRWLPKQLDGMEAAMLLADKSHLEGCRTAGVPRRRVSHLLAVSGFIWRCSAGCWASAGGGGSISRLSCCAVRRRCFICC